MRGDGWGLRFVKPVVRARRKTCSRLKGSVLPVRLRAPAVCIGTRWVEGVPGGVDRGKT